MEEIPQALALTIIGTVFQPWERKKRETGFSSTFAWYSQVGLSIGMYLPSYPRRRRGARVQALTKPPYEYPAKVEDEYQRQLLIVLLVVGSPCQHGVRCPSAY